MRRDYIWGGNIGCLQKLEMLGSWDMWGFPYIRALHQKHGIADTSVTNSTSVNNLLTFRKMGPKKVLPLGQSWLLSYDAKEGCEAGCLALPFSNQGLESQVDSPTLNLASLCPSLISPSVWKVSLMSHCLNIYHYPSFPLFSQGRMLQRLWVIHKVHSNHHTLLPL